jgi:phage terminase small subunit
MGQRGPAPEPVNIRVLKGETRPSQLAGAPKPQDPPQQPADLSDEAAAVWDRILAATAHTEHIGASHADTFRTYCEVTARLQWRADPMSKEWRELANLHRQLARELCLTPATGANLPGRSQAPKDKLAKYLA